MLYEYECDDCGHITTVNCLMKDMQRTTPCEECGGVARKIISSPALCGVTSTKDKIKKEMIRNNEEAGKRCRAGSHVHMSRVKDI